MHQTIIHVAAAGFGSHFIGGAAVSKRIWLRKEICHKLAMTEQIFVVQPQITLQLKKSDEIVRYRLTYVKKSEERMAWFAEVDLVNRDAVASHKLAITFHIHLLYARRKLQQRLRGRQNRAGGLFEKNHVPDTHQASLSLFF